MSAPADSYELRPLRSLEELQACVRLQERVWGPGFSERVPVAILRIAGRLGGVLEGAYDPDGALSGFVFGLTGLENGEAAHWSDMLAVRPGLRDAGLGTRLKLHQRALLLEAGIRTAYWTFDPLESRNAWLNLGRLGAVAREYVVDMYGASGSPMHEGVGTDRLVALWLLDSPRVEARVGSGVAGGAADAPGEAGRLPEETTAALDPVLPAGGADGGRPRPGELRLGLEDDALSVAIPARIQEVKDADPGLARAWREATRATLSHYLERGWEVRELARGGQVSRYLLARPDALPRD